MSILIKGMAMPENCENCSAQIIDPTGGASGCAVNHSIILRKRGERRPAECPLVKVPPHGRLIDADKLLHDGDNDKGCIDEWINSPGLPDGVKIGIGAARNLVCYAPTVIEAEE